MKKFWSETWWRHKNFMIMKIWDIGCETLIDIPDIRVQIMNTVRTPETLTAFLT
jgi:hypothetical protein